MLKTCLITLLVYLMGTFAPAQPVVNNFNTIDGEVYWLKIYETQMSFDELFEAVKNSGKFQELSKSKNLISGQYNNFLPDYQGAGYKNINTAMYISTGKFYAIVTINYKQGKYRVTVKNIRLEANIANMQSNDRLETYAIKNRTFRKSFIKSDSKIFDYSFSKTFSFKVAESGEW